MWCYHLHVALPPVFHLQWNETRTHKIIHFVRNKKRQVWKRCTTQKVAWKRRTTQKRAWKRYTKRKQKQRNHIVNVFNENEQNQQQKKMFSFKRITTHFIKWSQTALNAWTQYMDCMNMDEWAKKNSNK